MKAKIKIGFIYLGLCAIGANARPHDFRAKSCGSLTDIGPKIVQTYVQQTGFTGSVLIARPGQGNRPEEIFESAVGFANRQKQIPNRVGTKFQIGSITKQFTAAAVLELARDRQLSIDDPVVSHLPSFPTGGNLGRLTIRNLLNHHSGLLDYAQGGVVTKSATHVAQMERAIFRAIARRPNIRPGKKFEYSNTNYFLLGRIVERKTGVSYASYLQSKFFKPLEMQSSGADGMGAQKNASIGYVKYGKDHYDPAPSNYMDAYSSGAIYSTVQDLHLWAHHFLGGLASQRDVRREMISSHPGEDYGFGIGVKRHKIWGRSAISLEHDGAVEGYSSFLAHFPTENVTIVVLSNLEESPVDELAKDLTRLAFCDVPAAPTKKS